MATRFRSGDRREWWVGFFIGLGTDFIVAYLVALFLTDDAPALLALAIQLGAYAFQALYGLISLARGAALFFLFEKKRRVKLAVSQFRSAQMPVPNAFYDDPVQYFLEVANSDAAPKEARLLAGAAVGTIEGLRWGNRPFLVMTTLMVLEEAISKYAETGALKSGEVDYFAGVDMS